ncbi:MAG: HDOD domain-containing protein, partial [Gammaproteobacteria bacterium]|nr:HDOD domain-containing protein [Gammaproteobacteria bacterium]
LPPRWFEGHRLFLHSGQLELRMANERRVFLSSVSPPARFPLPPPHLAQIRSVGHTTFVRVPLAQDRPRATRIAADSAADPLIASLSRILFKRLDAGDIPLPSMPDLAVKLNGALRESDSARDAHDIAKLIQLDPALATKVIHVVNSAAFGFVRKAGSVQQAVTRLGRDRIRNVAVGFLMR